MLNPRKIEVVSNKIKPVVRETTFKHANYNPHKYQRLVHNSSARFRVAACGRRFGKSSLGGMDLVTEAYITSQMLPMLDEMGKRREFWIVGPNYSDSEKEFRVAWNSLNKLQLPFDKPGSYNNPNAGDMHISAFGGKFLINAKSAAHPESLVGEGLNGVIMAEAAKQKESTWLKYIRPMLSDFLGWALFSSTPEGRNWFYEMWNRGQSIEHADYESWRLQSWLNPFLYQQITKIQAVKQLQYLLKNHFQITEALEEKLDIDPEIVSLILDLTEETFNQEIAAAFTDFVGLVFKDFDEEVHVQDLEFHPDWETCAAVDYGFRNPFVWLVIQVNPANGTTHVFDEYYMSGKTIDEIPEELKAHRVLYPQIRNFYPDPASPGDSAVLQDKLFINPVGGTGGELNLRIRAIRQALKVRNPHLPWGHIDRTPRLLVNRRCTNTIREFNAYRYPATKEESSNNPPENPLKKDDHTLEALGRFFAGRFAHTAPDRATRVSSAGYG